MDAEQCAAFDDHARLMAAVRIHRSELDYARENGTEALFAKLIEHGHYPYADLDREPVV